MRDLRLLLAGPVVLALVACGADGVGPPTGGGSSAPRFEVGDVLTDEGDDGWPLEVATVQFAQDGSVAATCGAAVCTWAAAGGRGEAAGIGGAALDVDAGVAVQAAGSEVLVVDTGSGEVGAVLDEHGPADDTLPPVVGLDLAADAGLAASAGTEGRALTWSLEDGSVVSEVDLPDDEVSVAAPLLSPDGALAAVEYSVGLREDAVASSRLVDTADGTVVAEADDVGRFLAWSPDGAWLLARDGDGELVVRDADDLSEVASSATPSGDVAAVSPDAATVAFVDGEDDTTIRLWSPGDGDDPRVRTIRTDHPDPIGGLAWSDDGTVLASASSEATSEPAPTPDAPRDQVQLRDVGGGAGDRPVVRLRLPRA